MKKNNYRKDLQIFWFLMFLLINTSQQSSCPVGTSTEYDGFQDTWLTSAYFQQQSVFQYKSPFLYLKKATKMNDLYISLWIKFQSDDNLTSTFIKCQEKQDLDMISIDFGIYSDSDKDSLNLKGQVMEQIVGKPIEAIKSQQKLNFVKWNYYSVFANNSDMAFSINGNDIMQKSVDQTYLIERLIQLQQHEDDIIHHCITGTHNFTGYMRHLVFAIDKSSKSDYDSFYMHQKPTALDKHLLAYYSFEGSLRNAFLIDINDSSLQQSITYDLSNELDMICQCDNDNLQSSNFPYLNSKSYFSEIQNVTANHTIDQISVLIIDFTIYIEEIKSVNYVELFAHKQIWSIGIVNKSHIQFNNFNKNLTFTFENDEIFSKSVFINSWINYQLRIISDGATLVVNDFTQQPIQQTITLDLPLYFPQIKLTTDTFKVSSSQLTLALHTLDYKLNGQTILQFDFSYNGNFIQTSGDLNLAALDKDKTQMGVSGYFNSSSQQIYTSGLKFKQIKGPCNQSDPTYSFDGLVCKDSKKFMAFNQQSNMTLGKGAIQAYVKSSSGYFTFETWFKFQGFTILNQTRATIMANYQLMSNPLILISIGKGVDNDNSSYYLECNPYYQIKKIPNYLDPVIMNKTIKLNQWQHMACVSKSDIDDQWLKLLFFDHQSQQENEAIVKNSHTVNMPSTTPLRTYIGNTMNETDPFTGLIRELRIWKETRTHDQIAFFRYQSIPLSQRDNLLSYSMMNQGFGEKFNELSYVANYYTDFQVTSKFSPFTWVKDEALKICPPDTVYQVQTQCCIKFDFSYEIKKRYEENEDGENLLVLSLQIRDQDNIEPNLMLFTNSWSLLSYEDEVIDDNNISQTMIDALQNIIDNQQNFQNFELWIPIKILSSQATYVFQAQVQSFLKNYDGVKTQTIQISPECPSIEIQPVSNEEHLIIASKHMIPSNVKLNVVIQDQCQKPIKIDSILWSSNTENIDFQLQQLNTSLIFNKLDWKQENISITATLKYEKDSIIYEISDYALISIVDYPFSLYLRDIPDKLSLKDKIIVDPSPSWIFINYPEILALNYKLECPRALFKTKEDMDRLSTPDQITGLVVLTPDELNIIRHAQYNFTYVMYSDFYNYSMSQSFSVSYSQVEYFSCPSTSLVTYMHFAKNQDLFLIKPHIYLDCETSLDISESETIHYEMQDIYWEVAGYEKASDFLNISQDGLIAFVRDDVKPLLEPGFNVKITLHTMIDNQKFNSTTLLVITKSYVDIMLNSNAAQTISVLFNETMILDASQSKDPDYPNDKIEFLWECFNTIGQNQCGLGNSQSGLLNLNPFQRLEKEFIIGVKNKFTITARNPTYPESKISKDIYKIFQRYDRSKKIYNGCELEMLNGSNDYYFNYANASELELSIQIDQDKCDHLKSMNSKYYVFQDSDQNFLDTYYEGDTVFVQKESIFQMLLGSTLFVDFVYQFSYLEQSSVKYDYIVKTIEIKKTQSPLIVVFQSNEIISLGTEESFIIDSSNSFDPDATTQQTFNYFWTCPEKMQCFQQGSKFLITKQMRQQTSLNTIGSNITIGLVITSKTGSKKSDQTNITFKIINQNISNCLDVALASQTDQIIIYRDSHFPYYIRLLVDKICDSVIINDIKWLPQNQDVIKFWEAGDENGQTMIIRSQLMIPTNYTEIDFTAQVKYSINETNYNGSYLTKEVSFSILIKEASIIPIINLNRQSLFIQNQTLVIDASQSSNPNNQSEKLTCLWSCPPNLLDKSLCQIPDVDCVFSVDKGGFNKLDFGLDFQVIYFNVEISSQNVGSSVTKNISITLIDTLVYENLPQCDIQNIKGNTYHYTDAMTFYSSCNFESQKALGKSENKDYKFQWILKPEVQGLITNLQKLQILPYQLVNNIKNKTSRQIEITLKIYTLQQDGNIEFEYKIWKHFDIPTFDSFLTLFEQPSSIVEIIPSRGYSLFSTFLLTFNNFILMNSQYLRLRIGKLDGSQEVLLHQAYNQSYLLTFPKQTQALYIDLIERQRSNNDYVVYTYSPQVQIDDLNFISIQSFYQLIIPQLKGEISIQDYSDISQIELELNNLYSNAVAIAGINDDIQPTYFKMLLDKLQIIKEKVDLGNSHYFSEEQLLLLKAKLLRIVVIPYVKLNSTTEIINYQELDDYIFNELISDEIITQVLYPNTNYEVQQIYSKYVFLLLNTTKNLDQYKAVEIEKIYYQIQNTLMVEGDTVYFQKNNKSQGILYKINDLDILQNKDISLFSTNNLVNEAKIKLKAQNLPAHSQLIEIQVVGNEENFNYSNTSQTYYVSNSSTLMNIMDRNLERVTLQNFMVNIDFQLQPSILQEIKYINNLTSMIRCISKQDSEVDYNFNETSIITDLTLAKQGRVTCQSPHLSTFNVIYKPQQNFYTIDIAPYTADVIGIFQQIPALKFVLPIAFFSFTGIMLLLGKIMNELNKQRPKRFFNKLTLNENLKKYNFSRLLGAIILQFNPFFNYVIKTNYYLSRPLRLLMLTTYFLSISSVSLLYFLARNNIILTGEIFILSLIMFAAILILRSRIQNWIFVLFYPKNLKKWRYTYQDQSQQEQNRIVDRRFNDDEQLQDDYEDLSIRLENSMNRMIDNSPSYLNQKGTNKQVQEEELIAGDEIVQFRKKKIKGKIHQSQEHKHSHLPKKQKKKKSSIQQLRYHNRPNNNDLESEGIEMQDIIKKKPDAIYININGESLQLNESQLIHEQHELDDEIIQKEMDANSILGKGNDVLVADNDNDEEILDEEMTKIQIKLETEQQIVNKDEEDDLDIIIENQQYEGGEEEEKEKDDQQQELNKYQNYNQKQKKPKKSKPKSDKQGPKKNKDEVNSEFYVIQNHSNYVVDQYQEENSNQQIDESTPSLENVYENYRELESQDISFGRRLIGLCLLLLTCFTLFFVHSFLLQGIQENQFQNWFTCASFTFLIQVFLIDTLLYAFIAWYLKRQRFDKNDRKLCSYYNIFVIYPLGKYKFMELEIELAKMKDFDKEYSLLAYV